MRANLVYVNRSWQGPTAAIRTAVQIRTAETSDADRIAAILADSFAEFASLYTAEGLAATTPSAEEVRRGMEEGPTWVAAFKGGMVGTVSAVLKSASGLYVRGMAVLPSARGQHVGEGLLNAVCGFAVKNGCSRPFLSTTPISCRRDSLVRTIRFHADR